MTELRFKNGDPVRFCISAIPEPKYGYGKVVGLASTEGIPIWIVQVERTPDYQPNWDCFVFPEPFLLDP